MSAVSPDRTESAGRFERWSSRLRAHEDKFFLILTLVIGALVGLVVVTFVLLTERVGARMYPPSGAPWRRLLVPTIGSLVTGYLIYRYFPNARGSGIPQTKVALFVHEGQIRLRTVLGKYFCCSASLASGIALGREGPCVQIGAGIASVIGQKLGLAPNRIRSLIPIGTAAALAAAFNTPIAAVLFSLEEIMGDLNAPVLGSIVLSSATSWMVLHLMLGDEPLFHVPPYQLVHPLEFLIYAFLGVFGGMVSIVFVKGTLLLRAAFARLPRFTRAIQPVAGGLTVGALGWFLPPVLGIGYVYVNQVLNADQSARYLIILLAMKLLAIVVCYGSGNAGGIFGPSLFLGAVLGGAVGHFGHRFFPGYTGTPGAYALVGMGTTFAGIVRTPLASVIMIFELTRDYSIIVPLMISNLIAFYISYRAQPVPIYEALAEQDGIHLPGASVKRRQRLRVFNALKKPASLCRPDTPIRDALGSSINGICFVSEPRGDYESLWGIVPPSAIEQALTAGAGDKPVSSLIALPPESPDPLDAHRFPHLHTDHSLDLALQRMGQLGLSALPVVERSNVRKLLGVITLRDTLRAYGVAESAAAQK